MRVLCCVLCVFLLCHLLLSFSVRRPHSWVDQFKVPIPTITPNKANNTNLRFDLLPKDSFKGLVEVLPSAFALAKRGDSDMFFRIYTEIPTMKIENKKGSRIRLIQFTWQSSKARHEGR